MKKSISNTIFPLICALFSLQACAPNTATIDGFSTHEYELINEIEGGNLMRILQYDANLDDNDGDNMVLKSECEEFPTQALASKTFRILVDRMVETVKHYEGVGLAAPQVGVLKRVVVVQRFDKQGEPFEVFINPVIMDLGAKEEFVQAEEGCLSIPDQRVNMWRSRSIVLSYFDLELHTQIVVRIEGFTAVILQHEIDHLDGILITDVDLGS